MTFTNPWGLLGLIAIPTILFIHLYQRRFPRLEIAGLHLWADEEQTKTAGRRIDRLPITKSLLLELLAALLLALLLAQPKLVDSGAAAHWIIVLDDSASMMGQPSGELSFRDRAVQEIEARAGRTARESRFTIILTGRRPEMVAGPAVDWTTAQSALTDWMPQGTRHDFQSAWDMASQLSDFSGRMLFITDTLEQQGQLPSRMELVAVGEAVPNLAFETSRWSIDSQSLTGSLYLRVKNYSNDPGSATLVGRSSGQEVFRKDIVAESGQSVPLTTRLPGGIKHLQVEIESQRDRLRTDSQIELIEPAVRTVKIAVSMPEEHPGRLEIVRVLGTLRDISLTGLDDADLVIIPSQSQSNVQTSVWELVVGPLDLDEEKRKESLSTAGPFLLERRNALLDGITMSGVLWAGVQNFDRPLSPLISAGPEILMGRLTESPSNHSYLLNVDLSASNLSDSPDWPILWSNLIEACRQSRPGLQRWNYRLDEIVTFGLEDDGNDDAQPLLLKHPVKERNLVRSDTVEIPALAEIGVYELVDGDNPIGRFAVNFFDSKESDLSQLSSGNQPPEEVSGAANVELVDTAPWIWMLLIALTMLVALGDWAVLKKKPAAAAEHA